MINVPFLRSPYNYDRNAAGDESGIDCLFDRATGEATPSLAQQSFAEEVDINTIVRRFGISGQLPQNVRAPTFGDFENIPNYHDAMNAIRQADESFNAMPAEVRYRFNNDPGRFVEFVSDENNRAEAIRLGLVVPPVVVEPVVPPVVPAAPAGPGAPLVT